MIRFRCAKSISTFFLTWPQGHIGVCHCQLPGMVPCVLMLVASNLADDGIRDVACPNKVVRFQS